MGKCKNCDGETKNNNVYCSYKCRNIYVNKNLRDYSKVSKTLRERTRRSYKPKKCKNCSKDIKYEKRGNLYFCSRSCSTSYSNKQRNYNPKFTKEGLESIRLSNRERTINERIEYYSNIKRCKVCNKMLPFNKRFNTFCNIKCKNNFYENTKSEYELYKSRSKFKFNLLDYKDEFDFSLIEKYGWYKAKNRGDNLNGVSRDHMISIKDGFKMGIDPKIISHPANCELMRHSNNSSKCDKSSITIEQLKNKIKDWDKKYNK